MIVYNVQRRFFTKMHDADVYRVAQGLSRGGQKNIVKIEIRTRDELAALLNALCEPGSDPLAEANLPASDPKALVDRAYVAPNRDIPRFLRESWAKLYPKICDHG